MPEGINIDDLCVKIEDQYQKFENIARSVSSLDDLADVVKNMSDLAKVVRDIMTAVMKLQDEVKSLKSK